MQEPRQEYFVQSSLLIPVPYTEWEEAMAQWQNIQFTCRRFQIQSLASIFKWIKLEVMQKTSTGDLGLWAGVDNMELDGSMVWSSIKELYGSSQMATEEALQEGAHMSIQMLCPQSALTWKQSSWWWTVASERERLLHCLLWLTKCLEWQGRTALLGKFTPKLVLFWVGCSGLEMALQHQMCRFGRAHASDLRPPQG